MAINKEVLYDIQELLKEPNGQEQIIRIAQQNFIGNKVITYHGNGFCGGTKVVGIALPNHDELPALFIMLDESGRRDCFFDSFGFELRPWLN